MKLHALKFGIAAAIVSAIFVLVSRLLLLAAPYGPMRGGGFAGQGYMPGAMMHGYGRYVTGGGYHYGHMYGFGWGGYFAALVIGLIVVPLVAGIAAWATAAVYNRLLDREGPDVPPDTSD